MICLCLLNHQTVSYLEKAKDENIPKRKMLEYITNKIVIGSVPKLSNNYEHQRVIAWFNLQEVNTLQLTSCRKSSKSDQFTTVTRCALTREAL